MREHRQMLVLNSITYAYKARDYLAQQGIRAYVERIPANLRTTGCGYGVRVNNDGEQIAQLLDQAGIRVKRILDL
ncbi:MAG: DUF3343 domain-containing protein [Oscillospiraceae bacterium]|nr:DUF3343 domain-containing protein [Oscillospiraceae bacterium]